MEDESEIELSLGLSCGGSSGKSMVDTPSNRKVEEGSRSDTSGPSFKNFFHTGNERQDSKGKQRSDPILLQNENFFMDLTTGAASARDASHGVHSMWISKGRTADSEKDSNKRKLPFEEVIFQNKHEKVVDYTNVPVKNPISLNIFRNSQVSNPVENVFAIKNEDIAESETTEGSNSLLVSQREDKFKCSNISKFTKKYVLSTSSGSCSEGRKESPVSRVETNNESGAYGIPLSLPYPNHARLASTPCASNPTRYPSPCVMQMKPVATNEHSSGQAPNTSNLPLAFGFQLPILETGSSWAFKSQPRLAKHNADGGSSSQHSAGKTSGSVHASLVSSSAVVSEGNSLDLAKANGKHAGEVITPKIQDEGKDSISMSTRQPVVDPFPQLGLSIKHGLASEVKFGGGGSCPNLPWVSTTGVGPNAKPISGVTYKYNQNQVKIVCACHGTHMSPEEFVRHASADASKAEDKAAFLSSTAASAKS